MTHPIKCDFMSVDELIPIQNTFYKDYFENIVGNVVYQLKESDAIEAWSNEIAPDSSSYFNLPDNCWIVACDSYLIGEWLDAYNDDNSTTVIKILRDSITWDENTIIKFFVKKNIVFKTRWRDFIILWDNFISIDDDCPIVVPEKNPDKEALLFRPVGDILKINC